MAVSGDTLIVPARAHAEAAADILVAEGAALVLLHGSVARGTSHAASDVDLVAVFDNIDYTERLPLRWRLEAMCEAAVGVPFDVHVTDLPEWRHRTEHVASSYEAAVASHHHLLRERASQPEAVKWDKPIGLATDNTDEAMNRLANVKQAIRETARACKLDGDEVRFVDGTEEVDLDAREGRLIGLCSHAAMTIETSLKAWRAAVGAESKRVHRIADLMQGAAPLPAAVEDALAPLAVNTLRPSPGTFDDISCWRKSATYLDEAPHPAPDNLERIARALTAAAPVTVDAVLQRLLDDGVDPADERFAKCATQMHRLRAVLQAADPVTGESLPADVSEITMVPPPQKAAQPSKQRHGLLSRLFRGRKAKRIPPPQRRVCGRGTRGGGRCQRRVGPSGYCPRHS